MNVMVTTIFRGAYDCTVADNEEGILMLSPHIIIIGGGFGGLRAAQKLGRAPVRVTLIDRRNHHLFQPLLYQVATAGLSPADIAVPIRSILRRFKNTQVLMDEVVHVDTLAKRVSTRHRDLTYDYWSSQLDRNTATSATTNGRGLHLGSRPSKTLRLFEA